MIQEPFFSNSLEPISISNGNQSFVGTHRRILHRSNQRSRLSPLTTDGSAVCRHRIINDALKNVDLKTRTRGLDVDVNGLAGKFVSIMAVAFRLVELKIASDKHISVRLDLVSTEKLK
jgi:hypothetical protein